MTIYLTKGPGYVLLQARAEGEGAIGDMTAELHPGDKAFGRTFDEWNALPDGPYEVK